MLPYWDLRPPQLQIFILSYGTRHDILLVERTLRSIQEPLVSSSLAESLLHKHAPPAWHASILACRVHS